MNIYSISMLKYLAIFSASYLCTFILTPLVSKLAWRFGILDFPEENRRIHKEPIPRIGGLAVFGGFQIGCFLIFLFPWIPKEQIIDWQWWSRFSIAASLLLVVGFIDDSVGLRAVYKLLGQVCAALLMFCFNVKVGSVLGIELPLLLDLFATIFWFVIIINAFNLIDGFDGLATGLAIISAVGIAGTLLYRHLPFETLILSSLIGSCVAFLRFNAHPAKIFLGDTGSMFLGFTLASIALGTSTKGTSMAAIWVPLLALGVPIFDTVLAIWRRGARRIFRLLNSSGLSSGIMTADMEHVHHRLMKAGLTPKNVTRVLYLANSFLVLIGLAALAFRDIALAIMLTSFTAITFLLVRFVVKRELWDSGLVLIFGLGDWTRPLLNVVLFCILDFVGLSIILLLSLIISFPANSIPENLFNLRILTPVWIGLPILLLLATELYRRRKLPVLTISLHRLAPAVMAVGLVLLSTEVYMSSYSNFSLLDLLFPTDLINSDDPTLYLGPIALSTFYIGLAYPYLVGIRYIPSIVEILMRRKVYRSK